MTPEDRELIHSLRREQLELQRSLARIDARLADLETRTQTETALEEMVLPPVPEDLHSHLPPLPPPVEPEPAHLELPPIPTAEPAVPDLPPLPQPTGPRPSLEFQFGRWLIRIGAVFFVLALISVDAFFHIHERLNALGKIGIMGVVTVAVTAFGQRLERKNAFVGRTFMAMGLAGLYFTLYAAHSIDNLRVVHNPFIAGCLLLLWSAYVFWIAERKRSQTLSLFAITLAYFSSAINPIGMFTMGADLLLAATAVIFLLRNGWAALSYLSLAGTYYALLHRLIIDESGEIVLDTSRALHFWPYAIYLTGAWIIFTAAVLLSRSPSFRGGNRLTFLSLNNGALAGLLALTAHITGYDYGQVGWMLFFSGAALLLTSVLAGLMGGHVSETSRAYLGQGLALFTLGLMIIYTGVTRGVLLGVETLFLGMAANFSRSAILNFFTHVLAFFATLFLIWEVAVNAHHPWMLGVGGALIMRLNAWWARRDVRHDPKISHRVVPSAAYYCSLALGLIFTAMYTELSDSVLPPSLAVLALALTFWVYLIPLYELPPTAQALLLIAQYLVLFPVETGEELPWWSAALVAAVTLVMITWWSRQRVLRTGVAMAALNYIYGFALAGLAYHAVRPYTTPQDWLVSASLLSIAFLAFGAFTRVWPVAATGQVFLVSALCHFFIPPGGWDLHRFSWDWYAAAVPIITVFSIARAGRAWLRVFPEITGLRRTILGVLARGYQLLALVMTARWICAVVPTWDLTAVFLFFGTLLFAWNIRWPSSFGVRASFVFSILGLLVYLHHFSNDERAMATFLNGLAIFCFLTQPAMLHRTIQPLVTRLESWVLIFLSVGLGWLFVSAWVQTRIHLNYLTMGWALYALFLFLFGLLVRERRLRWCGLAILLVAIIRVFTWDFWGFSNGYKVLTFIALTIISLSLGYIIVRFADRLKTWL